MDTSLLRNLKNKENRCSNYKRQADTIYRQNNRQYTEDQCLLLQRAADLESEMASMTIGAEREHHIREKNRLDYEIMRIRSVLDGTAAKSGDKEKKPGKPVPGKEKSRDEQELDSAVRTWYKDKPRHSFEDVAGMEEMKKKLAGCIADAQAGDLREYLKIPKLNSYFFVGPPGCGKTYIVEAFAHELMDQDYKFISILGSDIISKYVGAAEKSVTRLFEEAVNNAPCIVFIDEIDSLCKNRSLPNLPEYAANITTSFLTGYNRIHSEDSKVIFIAATNYPNRVDAAMLDRAEIIRLSLPDKEARKAAFVRYFESIVQLKKGLTFDLMAEKTWRFNYRDIERLTSALKLALFHDVLDLFGDQGLAIEALTSGKFKLSVEKFDEVLESFKPSPKEMIINDLVTWEKSVQSVVDFAETDTASLYDCEPLTAHKNAPAEAAQEPDEEEAEEPEGAAEPAAEPESTEPVYPLSESFTVDPLLGIAEIRFRIGARQANGVKAYVNSAPVDLETDGIDYWFVVEPDEDSDELDVFVKDEAGYIGAFTAVINRAISDNKDFDI